MKLTINRSDFLAAAKRVFPAVPRATQKPVLLYVLVAIEADRLVLTATDLETSIRATMLLPPDNIDTRGTLTRKFLLSPRAIGLLQNDESKVVNLLLADNGLSITTDSARFEEATIAPGAFPEVNPHIDAPIWEAEMPGRELAEALRRASALSGGIDEARYALAAICLDRHSDVTLAVVASDGRVLSCQEITAPPPPGPILVPFDHCRQIAALIQETETVSVSASDNMIVLDAGSLQIMTRLREGRYPKWQDWLPSRNHQGVVVPCGTLLAHVNRMAVAIVEKDTSLTPAIRIVISNERITFAIDGSATEASSELPVASGEAGECLIHHTMLLPLLRALSPDETITLSMWERGLHLSAESNWCGAACGIKRT